MSPLEAFARTIRGALAEADRLPVEEHARLAHRAGGPSVEELIARISASRARSGRLIAA